jgi:phage baseplate assembly protein W
VTHIGVPLRIDGSGRGAVATGPDYLRALIREVLFDGRGWTATASEEEWIRGLIEQVLFTAPGERVMRPDFGSGLMQLVFAPTDDALAASTQLTVQSALQRWLGDLIDVAAVEVESDQETLRVLVAYTVRGSGLGVTEEFRQAL